MLTCLVFTEGVVAMFIMCQKPVLSIEHKPVIIIKLIILSSDII